MISNKEIICPENLLKIAKTKGPVKAVIVNAGKKVAGMFLIMRLFMNLWKIIQHQLQQN